MSHFQNFAADAAGKKLRFARFNRASRGLIWSELIRINSNQFESIRINSNQFESIRINSGSKILRSFFLHCLRLYLSQRDSDSRPLFLVSPLLSQYIHIHIYIWSINVQETYLFEFILLGADKTGTSPNSGHVSKSKRLLVPVTQSWHFTVLGPRISLYH